MNERMPVENTSPVMLQIGNTIRIDEESYEITRVRFAKNRTSHSGV